MPKYTKHDLIRIAAEESLLQFIKLVAPHRLLGQIHKDLINWWEREDAKQHQLVLLPRDHQKSTLVAYRAAWAITKNPEITILYISSTATLAEKQLYSIQQVLESDIYRRYWPEMVLKEPGLRETWSKREIIVDHPLRKEAFIRDPTVFTAGLTTSITGLHFDIAILDDVVVNENAYTKNGRETVKTLYSLLSSIETADAKEWVVGTRYHPDDLYGDMQDMIATEVDEFGHLASEESVYEIFQRVVEDRGDGSGTYLWPRQQRDDGRWYGFNQKILAQKRAKYLDRTHFRSQYYNNPNDPDSEAISSDLFQYYNRKYLVRDSGTRWTFKKSPLNVFAAIDFAFSLSSKADYTALVVIGIDPNGDIYLLEIDRFRSNKISEYYEAIFKAWSKWGFRKIRAEVTIAQEAIVEQLKDRIKQQGIPLSIDTFRPMKYIGSKEERIQAELSPRYENLAMWHFESGLVMELEDELRQERPKHDDIKDALAMAVAIAKPPRAQHRTRERKVIYHERFGGVSA